MLPYEETDAIRLRLKAPFYEGSSVYPGVTWPETLEVACQWRDDVFTYHVEVTRVYPEGPIPSLDAQSLPLPYREALSTLSLGVLWRTLQEEYTRLQAYALHLSDLEQYRQYVGDLPAPKG